MVSGYFENLVYLNYLQNKQEQEGAMRKDRQFTSPAAVPSEEGIREREVGNNGKKGKKAAVRPKTETADNSVFEVKIDPVVKTRLIKTETSKSAETESTQADSIQFEENRWPYILALPIMWLLTLWVIAKKTVYRLFGSQPKINTLWFDGLGLWSRKVKDGAASWKALDVIYNHPFNNHYGFGGVIDEFWWSIQNCQSIRNRLKLVKQEIRQAIMQFSNHEEVRLLSLAAGSAQGVIEVMAELKSKGIRVRALLIDIDQTALDYAEKLANRYGVGGQIEMVKKNVVQVCRISRDRDFRPQIIEMLGLLDYIPQDKAIRLIRKIRGSLEAGGIFLTCNVAPNSEMRFVRWVINWPMTCRTSTELTEIVSRAGFSNFRLIYEPLKIHGLVIAQKTGA